MNRRKFIKHNGHLALLVPFAPNLLIPGSEVSPVLPFDRSEKPEWLVRMIKKNDANLATIFPRLEEDRDDPDFGAVLDGNGMPSPHAATAFLKTGCCALICPESVHYADAGLVERLGRAANFLLRLQHSDGTIDLLSTNFHSTPDTGFIVKWLAPVWRLLAGSNVPGKDRITLPLKQFLLQGGEALKVGGIHTPNHRWVVCSALAELHKIEQDPAYLARAERWLSEGIDMDEDGQYEEKSSYIYSSLSNRVLISTARGFDKPELYAYVRRNLDMNFYYLHPNGEIVTEASGRQDNSIIGTLENYYYPYRYMALKDGNGQYAAACRLIEETAFEKTAGFLYYFLDDERLWEELPAAKPLPRSYAKVFPNSNLARVRRGAYDASILAKSPVFFTFHKAGLALQGIRFASAFFGKGQFVSETLTENEGAFQLSSYLQGPYYQPFPADKIPGDGDWAKMPRSERPQSEVQKLHSQVTVREEGQGFSVEISIEGTERVPVALELIFRAGGTFVGTVPHETLEDTYYLKSGTGTYSHAGSSIRFGPGLHRHRWVQIRGALPKQDAPTVFLTGYTPFHHVLSIT
ncbi:hypothetical protein SAMN05192553_101401 [Cyclobacterium xiamenense]|uniref:Heparinase II/III-like protein n=1 Tax=Cyclobacterium xiamenense TaxID=1297121 RepID=A0A1H6U136_9BACT|nr:hypothetical protein [Cyclobacterium xiamenense]SEI81652.1 hypothetical protein SAMN05192553_101401 [Cyclobacterium xiamenense]